MKTMQGIIDSIKENRNEPIKPLTKEMMQGIMGGLFHSKGIHTNEKMVHMFDDMFIK